MSYPYAYRTRRKVEEVVYDHATGDCASGTATVSLQLPPGAWGISLMVQASGTDQAVAVTVAPFVDQAQTIVDSNYDFMPTGSTTSVTVVSVAGTSTSAGGGAYVLPASDQYPTLVVHGLQMTIATTATSGTWDVAYTAVEL